MAVLLSLQFYVLKKFIEHNLQFPMSCLKRRLDGQDPDYEDPIPIEVKRLRLLEKNGNYVIVNILLC